MNIHKASDVLGSHNCYESVEDCTKVPVKVYTPIQ